MRTMESLLEPSPTLSDSEKEDLRDDLLRPLAGINSAREYIGDIVDANFDNIIYTDVIEKLADAQLNLAAVRRILEELRSET